MKIGIMVSGQKPQAGGGWTFEDDILEAFFRLRSQARHDFHLVGYAPERPPHLAATGLPWLSLDRPGNERRWQKWEKLRGELKIGRKRPPRLDYFAYPAVRDNPPDLIYYPTPQVRPIADIPYITTVWDLEHRLQPYFPEVSLHGEFESRERRYREVLPRATYILALGRRGRDQVINLYNIPPDRVRIQSLPTPGFALREGAKASGPKSLQHLGIIGDFLFYPAQFWAHKNHACLLHALAMLRDEHGFQPKLVLTGSDKGNRAHVENLVRKLKLQAQVVFPGFVAREDLIALYRQALALVFPTFFGPENLPSLEAMALGCPVIASNIPGHDDQLGDAAILADPVRPEEWRDAILHLRDNANARETKISAGRERAKRYTADHYISDLFRLFDEFAAIRRCWP
jgi:glycosyltransferase involved in cell wall biosynthesis